MAVAGLHNVSVFDSSFLRESQSPPSRRWGDQDRPSTRASSILQMWRELEGEHVVSHSNMRFGERGYRGGRLGSETPESDRLSTQESVNGNDSLDNPIMVDNENGSFSQSLTESENEHEDHNSLCSEQSTDLGEVERERVRQIFREWMNSGVKSHSPNVSLRNNRSRAQWLGQNERERVRIIREWVQMNSQQRGMCGSLRGDGIAEIGSQIEQVRDGIAVNYCEVAERKPIRKLCGRQALLDMLMRGQRERRKELQDLLEQRPVSDFAHRNRIQSLLKGRFLLNRRLVQEERPACSAASELGLLRERHTVSDLREGFLSKLDRDSVNCVQSDTFSSDGVEDHTSEQSHSGRNIQDESYEQSESSSVQIEINWNHPIDNIHRNAVEDMNQQEHNAAVTEVHQQVVEDIEDEPETSAIELISSRHGREDDVTGSSWDDVPQEWSQQISHTEGTVQIHLLETRQMYNEDDVHNIEASDVHEAYSLEGSMTEEFPWQSMSAQVEEWQESVTEHEESESIQFAGGEISGWTEAIRDGISENFQDNATNQWHQEPSVDGVEEHNHIRELDEEWHGNVLQEAIDSWLDGRSGQESGSTGRVDQFYFPDDENIQNMELRQLLSRRRVSTLLRSGFRESLDQLIQSYVQRQNNASVDWELDEASSAPASLDQDQEQQHGSQDGAQPHWDHQELQNDNWPDHNPHQPIGNEWEIINEFRIDMARLHQRMNNMQRMLEACMDMQLELQRSVRQEVSAALNRSVISADACKDNFLMDEAKWDHVRKGICCICSEKNIDSLLYRCGHMCTCSKCAEKLLQGGKCPMCSAPVIEVVRAYFTQ